MLVSRGPRWLERGASKTQAIGWNGTHTRPQLVPTVHEMLIFFPFWGPGYPANLHRSEGRHSLSDVP